jgi:predicted nuclease of predicted toxin-antitoxin system
MDVHVPRAIVQGLRLRNVEVLRAQDNGTDQFSDSQLLDRAMELGYVLFTFDRDLLQEANKRQQSGQPFAGVIYAHPFKISIGTCVKDVEILAHVYEPSDINNRVEYIPIK